ncbi:MAG: VUT family protein, partial [Bosea sp. (in: a-proteobacteria)]|nr:VUT family protein [Bosea sp. (in: a-proteobacteria)]
MTRDRQRQTEGAIALALFALTIPAANWMLGHVGTVCVPGGPCLVPVWPGIDAPSGVLMIGLALVLRDIVQRRLGPFAGLAAIAVGTLISALLAPPAIVLASVAAFTLSELA